MTIYRVIRILIEVICWSIFEASRTFDGVIVKIISEHLNNYDVIRILNGAIS